MYSNIRWLLIGTWLIAGASISAASSALAASASNGSSLLNAASSSYPKGMILLAQADLQQQMPTDERRQPPTSYSDSFSINYSGVEEPTAQSNRSWKGQAGSVQQNRPFPGNGHKEPSDAPRGPVAIPEPSTMLGLMGVSSFFALKRRRFVGKT